MRWSYYRGAAGRRFNVATKPTYECPLADVAAKWPAGVDLAAEQLGCSSLALAGLLAKAHRSHTYGRLRDGDGKLTEDCSVCGSRMERRGFRAWVDDDLDLETATTNEQSSAHIADRLGAAPPRRAVGATLWFETRREAMEWAREEARIHEAQAAEVRG